MTQVNAGKQKSGNKQQQNTIVYPGGDLLVSLSLQTGQRLFGGTAIQSRDRISECITVPNGDVPAQIAPCVAAMGITVAIPRSNDLEEVVIAIAQQLAQAISKQEGVTPEQLSRIALEYTVQAFALAPMYVEPFEQYVPNAIQLRQAFSRVNAAQKHATEQAFAKGDANKAVQAGMEARKAWGAVQTLLQQSPHLATYRAKIDLPFMFVETAGWLRLAHMKQEERKATIAQLKRLVEQSSNPFITEIRVQQAADRIAGLQRLSSGNAFGITPEAFVHAAAQGRLTEQAEPNGGTAAKFSGVDLSKLGELFRSMQGVASVTTEVQENGDVAVNAVVCESDQSATVSIPTYWTSSGKTFAQA